jgi:hypothetical protein
MKLTFFLLRRTSSGEKWNIFPCWWTWSSRKWNEKEKFSIECLTRTTKSLGVVGLCFIEVFHPGTFMSLVEAVEGCKRLQKATEGYRRVEEPREWIRAYVNTNIMNFPSSKLITPSKTALVECQKLIKLGNSAVHQPQLQAIHWIFI